jgi:hypothetical protein
MQRNLKVFRERESLPSQWSDRKGNCLSASARVLPLQRSKMMHDRKRLLSAYEANLASIKSSDAIVKSRKCPRIVIPVKTGNQRFQRVTITLDTGFHRGDDYFTRGSKVLTGIPV